MDKEIKTNKDLNENKKVIIESDQSVKSMEDQGIKIKDNGKIDDEGNDAITIQI